MSTKKLVAVISPFSSGDYSREQNRQYALELSKAILDAGHIPIVPHLFFTEMLDDDNSEDRRLGLNISMDLMSRCDCAIVGTKHGVQGGMELEIETISELMLLRMVIDKNDVVQAIKSMVAQ